MSFIAAFSGPGLANCVYLVVGSIEARVRRGGSRRRNEEQEAIRGLLEELEGPPQFNPWVAGPAIMSTISIPGNKRHVKTVQFPVVFVVGGWGV